MLKIGQKINLLTLDRSAIVDTGEITGITPESEHDEPFYEITLDTSGQMVEVPVSQEWRIELSDSENESWKDTFSRIFGGILGDKRKMAIVGFIAVAIFAGILLQVKQHNASDKLQVLPEKTQIQQWTDEMAGLEREKADHYERQKYLRSEDKKEVDAVKKLDVKIAKLKDKIHLYVKPSENDD